MTHLTALHTWGEFIAAGGARAFARSDGSTALPCDMLILTAPAGYCLPVGFERNLYDKPPAPVMAALHWIVWAAIDAFTENQPRDGGAGDRDELRALVATVDFMEKAGCAGMDDLRDSFPDDETCARILAWEPLDGGAPPPGYEVFETPSGRWAWERQDGGACGVGYLDRAQAVSRAYGDITARGEQG